MTTDPKQTILRRFGDDRCGNFAILFALSIVVVIMAAGLAVDYSVALMNKTRVSNALDAATLAAARGISVGELNPEVPNEVEDYLKAFFAANLGVDDLAASAFSVDEIVIDREADTVSATAGINQPLYLLRVGTGRDTMKVTSAASVKFDTGKVEVAMVLDVTSSMKYQEKLKALKDAATRAVEALLSVNRTGLDKTRVSIVPYSTGVNVGDDLAKYVYADHFLETSDAPVFNRALFNQTGVGYDWQAFQDDFPGCSNNDKCWAFRTDEDGRNIDNCAGDRKSPSSGLSYQYTNANPSSGMISRDARLLPDGCPSASINPLTSNESVLKDTIDSFAADGLTAGHIGLQWGWYMISHDWKDYLPTGSKPGDHSDPDSGITKVIILMTDGVTNTAYADVPYATWKPPNTGPSAESIKAAAIHLKELCTAIKDDDILLFTIAFKLLWWQHGEHDKLNDCATDETESTKYFFEAETNDELEDTFMEIVKTIHKLTLTK